MRQAVHFSPETRRAQQCHPDPLVFFRDHFLSPVECQHIINLAKNRLRQARVSLDESSTLSNARTGLNCWLNYEADPTINAIGNRVADSLGLSLATAEAMQVIYYGPGQEYRPHYDAYNLLTARGQRCCARGGQRLVTALGYLKDVEAGGATRFPKINVSVEARAGRLVVFENTSQDTTKPHPLSLHAGMPVLRGEKWAFNIWFHAEAMPTVIDFSKYQSPMLLRASQLPAPPSESTGGRIFVMANRAKQFLLRAAAEIETETSFSRENLCFTYWDTYGGQNLPSDEVPTTSRTFSLVDRKITNQFANRRAFLERLSEKSLTSLVPRTFLSREVAMAAALPLDKPLLAKPYLNGSGKAVFEINAAELRDFELPTGYLIQEKVTEIAFWDSTPFTARIYIVVWDKRLFIFDDALIFLHTPNGGLASKSQRAREEIELSSVFATHGDLIQALKNEISSLNLAFSEVREASDWDTYAVLGVDLILKSNGAFLIADINAAPNFVYQKEINERLSLPFFKALMTLVLGGKTGRFLTEAKIQ